MLGKYLVGTFALAGMAALSHSSVATLARADQLPHLRVCTGNPDLKYFKTGAAIAAQVRGIIDVALVASKGSIDNLRKLSRGECDAALVQNDAQDVFIAQNPGEALKLEDVGSVYSEYAHLLCNRDSGIGKISDLKSKPSTKVAIDEPTSGTATTWYALTAKDPAYAKVATVPLSNELALPRIIKGTEAQCLLTISGLKSQFMQRANELGDKKLQLVAFDDGALGKIKDSAGKPLYEYKNIDGGTYYNLQYGMFSTSVSTITVKAEFVVATDWYNTNQEAFVDLSTAVLRLAQQMESN